MCVHLGDSSQSCEEIVKIAQIVPVSVIIIVIIAVNVVQLLLILIVFVIVIVIFYPYEYHIDLCNVWLSCMAKTLMSDITRRLFNQMCSYLPCL